MQLISWERYGLLLSRKLQALQLELSSRSYPHVQIFPSKLTVTQVWSTEDKSNEPILGWVSWVGPCPVWTRLAFQKQGQRLVYLECEDSLHRLPAFLKRAGSLGDLLHSPQQFWAFLFTQGRGCPKRLCWPYPQQKVSFYPQRWVQGRGTTECPLLQYLARGWKATPGKMNHLPADVHPQVVRL